MSLLGFGHLKREYFYPRTTKFGEIIRVTQKTADIKQQSASWDEIQKKPDFVFGKKSKKQP